MVTVTGWGGASDSPKKAVFFGFGAMSRVESCPRLMGVASGRAIDSFQVVLILLMEEIQNNHLGYINLVNNGISYQPQLVSRISAINSRYQCLIEVDDILLANSCQEFFFGYFFGIRVHP